GWERARAGRRRDDAPRRAEEHIAALVLGRVVAITFTDRAAAEMATRVGEALAQIAAGELPNGILATSLPQPEAVRRERARFLLGALDQLVVRTIHAFCRRLLANHPFESGLHPRFEVDAQGLLQAEAIRDALEARLREAYSGAGDPLLLALAERGIGARELETALSELIDRQLPAAAFDADPFTPRRVRALRSRLIAGIDEMRSAEGGTLAGVGKRSPGTGRVERALVETRECLKSVPGDSHADLAALRDRLREVWSEKAIKRLREFEQGKFNDSEERCLGPRTRPLAEAAARVRRSLEHLLELDPELLDAARRVLRQLVAAAHEAMRRRGVTNYAALLGGARDLLRDHPHVRALEQARIDQLLVDEFQDTDTVQCEVIRLLALTGPRERRPGLFLVGDPKQSIYGWRSADLRAYDGFLEELLGAGSEARRVLTVNFRSVPAILAEVERVIMPVMQRREGLQPAFQPLVASPERAAESGFARDGFAPVEHWCSWPRSDAGRPSARDGAEQEARALAQDLLALHRRDVPWHTIGVLFRSTGDLDTYLTALREAGVPYSVERDKSYYRRREIIEAAALVRAVLDPADHLALLTLLRSALVGVPDAALLPLWKGGFVELAAELDAASPQVLERITALARAAARDAPADVPGIERIRGWEENLVAAAGAIATLREAFDRDGADAFVERLRTLFLVEATEAARYLGAYRAANLDRFFRELIAALEQGGGVQAALRRLRTSVAGAREAEEGRPKDARDNAVQLMTIHKAKGLDFEHVYVMQLHKQTAASRPAETEVAELDGAFEYRLFGAATPGFDRIAEQRDAVEAAELVRTLYVAMTRARDRLVLVGDWRQKRKPPGARPRAHTDLLESRHGATPDLERTLAELVGTGETQRDADGARWVFPALRATAEERLAVETAPSPLPAPEQVARESDALAERCERSRRRAARPFQTRASEEAHESLRELLAARRFAELDLETAPRAGIADDARARVAMAIGTAVHRALEDFDLEAPIEPEVELRRAGLEASLAGLVGVDELGGARERAVALFDRVACGPLLARLVHLAPHVIARELPVLLPPPDDRDDASGGAAVGFVSGAIDLVYRDPLDGALVVVDFKTDVVEGEAEIAERAAAYSSQGSAYTQALREALRLAQPPRFELWFLHPGRIVNASSAR
ncbi:MAG TPA: UvrD-helicase domain-containing protein, partial [Candidatus Bathyarchaeia archaeon]|nr:UvrD-helicase domain-containing protein [Candidatus Bathyarchaeia archaeon]